MEGPNFCSPKSTSGSSTDDGGAVSTPLPLEESPWFVLWVKARAEKSVRDNLIREGFEAFAATRQETHTWRRGERRKVEKVLIPSVVFVRMEKKDRPLVENMMNVTSLMRDPAKKGARSKGGEEYANLTDEEMRLFQQMLSQEDTEVNFASTGFKVGDFVRIKDFDETNSKAQIVRIYGDTKTYVGLRVSFLGCAYIQLPLNRIVRL